MVEKMSGSIGGNNRAADAIKKRQLSIKTWPDTETGKQPPVRRPDQFTINFEKGTVFLSAVASGDIEEVRNLLDEGVDIDFSNVDGLTALHQACIDENDEMVNLLIKRGADIEARDNEGWTPLHAAASAGNVDIAQILIKHNASLSAVNNEGEVPLDLVEDDDMEEYLEDVTEKQELDLEEARAEEEDLMLENAKKWASNNRIDDEQLDWQGATSLHVAAAKNYEEVLKKLLQIKGLDVNIPDVDGWTSLHAAMHWSNKEACEILAKAGADFNIRNSNGHTPCEVADPDFVKFAEGLRKQYATKNNTSSGQEEKVNGDFLKLVEKLLSTEPRLSALKGGREKSKGKNSTPVAITPTAKPEPTKPVTKPEPTPSRGTRDRYSLNKDTGSSGTAPERPRSTFSSIRTTNDSSSISSGRLKSASTADGGKSSSYSSSASNESSSTASDPPTNLGTYRSSRNPVSRFTSNHTPERGGDDDDDSYSSTPASRTSYSTSRTTDKFKTNDVTSATSRTSSWSTRNPSSRDTSSSTTRTSLYSSGASKTSTPSTDTGDSTSDLQQKLDKAVQEVEEYKQKYEKMKKEKEELERKLEQYKEDIDKMQELKSDNLRLKDENGALIRVISKLSRTPSSS